MESMLFEAGFWGIENEDERRVPSSLLPSGHSCYFSPLSSVVNKRDWRLAFYRAY